MKKISLFILALLISTELLYAQQALLQSGPMVGYATFKEVMLWVQTKEAAQVHVVYFNTQKPQERLQSAKHTTKAEQAFATHIPVAVTEGQQYQYELYINDQKVVLNHPLTFQSQTLWQHRKDPPAFRFVFGTCAYVNEPEVDRPGKPYGGEYGIFEQIRAKKPDFMLWGGDNVYLREVDWDTRSGILHRYTHTRSLPEAQALLGSVHHYAIWDDHDFGPDNSDASFWMKETSLEAFKLFWANPNYVDATYGTFFWNDAQFFLLDNRYFKTAPDSKTTEPTILGEAQFQWLVQALKYSNAPFKFVVMGGQFLNNSPNCLDAAWCENYLRHTAERQRIIDAIRDENITGVIFLTGDRHHSELSVLTEGVNYPLYDLTSSPLTSGGAGERGRNEGNTLRVPDTYYGERNFAVLDISGERLDRRLNITLFDNQGKQLWQHQIKANELK
jgi:alkaline phosphatase D